MIRSPLYYTGDKFKVLKSIIPHIDPKSKFIDLFMGGGSILANVKNKEILANDINSKLVGLLKFLHRQKNGELFLQKVFKIAKKYNLTTSFCEKYDKKSDKKYYAKVNKESFIKLRKEYNLKPTPMLLFLLIIYGYNRIMRFNASGNFNVPVGTLDLNTNVANHIIEFIDAIKDKNITFKNKDYLKIIKETKRGDVVFVDPPYMVSNAEYNGAWTVEQEEKLYKAMERKIEVGVKFLVTNYSYRNEKKNDIFNNWRKKYKNIELETFHYSHHNNKGADKKEYLVIGVKNG